MTWIKFALWLCGIYSIYYIALILWDSMRIRSAATPENAHELTFSEHVRAIAVLPDFYSDEDSDPIISSGGVSLKNVFNLAREEAIEYVRAVSF